MSTSKSLWKLPVAATAIVRGPLLRVLPKRQCEISFSIEGESGGEKPAGLLFEGVEAFKCTYLAALGSLSSQLFREAYASLISLEGSPWLAEVSKARSEYHAKAPTRPKVLQHLVMCFDDGPCYEILCEGFRPT